MTKLAHPQPTARTTAGRRLRSGLAAALVAAAAVIPTLATAAPASAAVSNCSYGYNNANTAWGHCDSGSGSWTLTVQCYYEGAHTSYGTDPGSIYASCPSPSHITNIILETQQ
ncbi:MAG: hypothetical protein QOH12_17 [Solirubrobacteraceae bacterium]|jgi:hypothetical protein|nr:hypothetical protein [Solirubrobacteraceae bacterium]